VTSTLPARYDLVQSDQQFASTSWPSPKWPACNDLVQSDQHIMTYFKVTSTLRAINDLVQSDQHFASTSWPSSRWPALPPHHDLVKSDQHFARTSWPSSKYQHLVTRGNFATYKKVFILLKWIPTLQNCLQTAYYSYNDNKITQYQWNEYISFYNTLVWCSLIPDKGNRSTDGMWWEELAFYGWY